MNRIWIKRGVAVFVFLISLFVMDFFLNRDNSEITTEMPKATLPVVSVLVEEHKINTMYGYTDRREEAYTKDNITPISEDRKITVVIDTYQADIKSVAYEVRSIDGNRLIENSNISALERTSDSIRFSIQLKDLTEANKEYAFVTILTMEDGEKVYYYTRFIQNENYCEKEKLDFIVDFHNITFSEDGTEIKKYLESNSKGDNSSFHKVDIHSSLKQVMWDLFPVEKVQEPVILMKDITNQTASVVLKYLVKEAGTREESYYFVEEYYRVRYTPNRMYLLEFERTMDEIFKPDKKSFSNDKIYLGITDENVEMMESEGGKNLAFINANRLFVYSSEDDKLSEVFSFYNKNNFDMRTRNRNFEIKILKMEDSGNLAFMVAGYMNRGIHEGEVGIAVYYYDTVQNAIEEQVFIPYKKSADVLIKEIDNLCYLNVENHLFLMMEGNLYDISLEQKNYEIVISNLTEDSYKVSESGRMISWLKENKRYESKSLYWLNLNDGKKIEIKSGYNEYITILGFMGEDIIYGLVESDDIKKETSGNTFFPIHKLIIRNQDNKILKNYSKENCYIVGYHFVDNQITLNRIQMNEEGKYKHIEDDHIASNDIQDKNITKINVVNNDIYKKVVQLVLKYTTNPALLKIMSPKEVIFEGGREVNLDWEQPQEKYYVYGPRGVETITAYPSVAVKTAYEISGSVVDADGNYIWKKGTIYARNQIMSIKGTKRDDDTGSLAVCLDTMLELEGISRKTQPMLDAGKDALNILKDSLRQDTVLDLRGCTVDVLLYYLDQDIPVLAMMENQEVYLIIGFNEYNVVLMDPKTGNVYKKGMNDSREMFENNGNQFITYMRVNNK